jgi:5'-nucleotidase
MGLDFSEILVVEVSSRALFNLEKENEVFASRTNGTFGFARYTSRPFAKPKEPFFANAQ